MYPQAPMAGQPNATHDARMFEAPQSGFFEFNTRQPPYAPNFSIAPQIDPHIPFMSGILIKAVQNDAHTNRLRTFLYNTMAANGYNNPHFTMLVTELACLVLYRMQTERYAGGIEDLIEDSADRITSYVASAMYCEDPVVRQHANFSVQQEQSVSKLYNNCRALQPQFQTIVNNVNHAQQPQMQPAMYPTQPQFAYPQNAPMNPHMQQPQYGGYPQQPQQPGYPVHQQPPQQQVVYYNINGQAVPHVIGPDGRAYPMQQHPQYASSRASVQHQPGYGQPQQNRGINPGMLVQANPGGQHFQEPNQTNPNARTYSRSAGGIAITDQATAPQAQTQSQHPQPSRAPQQPFQARQPVNQTQEELMQELQPNQSPQYQVPPQPQAVTQPYYEEIHGLEDWIPDEHSPYIPAWNPALQKPVYEVHPDGTRRIVIRLLTEEEKMDYEQHRVNKKVNEARVYAVKKAVAEEPKEIIRNDETHESSLPEYSYLVDEIEDLAMNVETVFLNHSRKLLSVQHETNDKPDVFTTTGVEIVPIVGDNASVSQDIIARVNNAKTLEEAAGILMDLRERYTAESDPSVSAQIARINRELGHAVNDRIRFGLSIENLETNDFATTVGFLKETIKEYYGAVALEAFLKDQDTFIRRVIGKPAPESIQALNQSLLDVEADPEAPLDEAEFVGSFFKRMHAITSVRLLNKDLELGLMEDRACAVFDKFTPLVHDIIERVFKATREKAIFKSFLVTEDNVTYEIMRGLYGTDFYQIRLVEDR